MANDQERGGPEDLGQDPFVERLRPDPSEPPEAIRILEGLLGDSDREGYRRLYFNRELDHYVEFRAEEVVFSEPIPPERDPFVGLDATRVSIRRDATIEYTRTRTPRPVDEFDLDVRLAAPRRRGGRSLHRTTLGCCIDDPATQCEPDCTEEFTGCPPVRCTEEFTGCTPPVKACTEEFTGCTPPVQRCTERFTGCPRPVQRCTEMHTGCLDCTLEQTACPPRR